MNLGNDFSIKSPYMYIYVSFKHYRSTNKMGFDLFSVGFGLNLVYLLNTDLSNKNLEHSEKNSRSFAKLTNNQKVSELE